MRCLIAGEGTRAKCSCCIQKQVAGKRAAMWIVLECQAVVSHCIRTVLMIQCDVFQQYPSDCFLHNYPYMVGGNENGFMGSPPVVLLMLLMAWQQVIRNDGAAGVDQMTEKILFTDRNWKLGAEEEGFTVMHIEIVGEENGSPVAYTWDLYDEYCPETKTSYMVRATGYAWVFIPRQVSALQNIWAEMKSVLILY